MSAGQKFKCEVCGKYFKAITNTHLKKHNMTATSYKSRFPNSIMGNFDRFSDWRNSEGNKLNLQRMTDKVYNTKEIRERKAASCREATQSEGYKLSQSLLMKEKIAKDPNKWPQLKSTVPTDWMKKSNYERWVIQYGVEEAEKRMLNWMNKNKLQRFNNKDTKCEIYFESHLIDLKIKYDKQFICNPFYADFYLPNYNLIVEIDGDYWHANPKKFSPDDIVGKKKQSAKEIWKRDDKKNEAYKKAGYSVLRIWDSDLKEKTTHQIFEDIVHASSKD